VTATAGLWLLRERLGRGPLTAWLDFLLTLFPALGFANFFPMRYSYVADHFQYLACIGPIVLFAAALSGSLPRWAGSTALLAIAAIFCVLANDRCRVYRDPKTLWADTLAKNPAAWAAHVGYGQALLDEGRLDAADAQFRAALQLRPDDGTIFTHIGLCYAMRGDDERAILCYRRALDLLPDSPEPIVHRFRAEPYYYMGIAYADLADRRGGDAHDRQLAIDAYRQAIQIEPHYELAMINLGLLYASEQKYDDAIDEYRRALLVNPDSVKARNNLGNALVALGRLDEAMDEYRQVLQDHPDNAIAHNGLGTAYARRGQWPAAIDQFQAAIRIDPGFDLARHNLLSALAAQQQGR
jgi:tetratricopeptide (TPR) repeat protein